MEIPHVEQPLGDGCLSRRYIHEVGFRRGCLGSGSSLYLGLHLGTVYTFGLIDNSDLIGAHIN